MKKYSIQSLGITAEAKNILKISFKIEEDLNNEFFEIQNFLKEKFPNGFTKEELVSELVRNNKEHLVKDILDTIEIYREDKFKKVNNDCSLNSGIAFLKIKNEISNEEILKNKIPDVRVLDENYINILETFKDQIITVYNFTVLDEKQNRFHISHHYPTGVIYLLDLGMFNIEIFDIYTRRGK